MSDSINYGIVGDVKAKAVAVGAGAQATVNESGSPADPDAVAKAIQSLSAQLMNLKLLPAAHELVQGDVEKLRQLAPTTADAPRQASGILERLTEKLKMVNVAVEAAAPLGAALKAVASLFGVPLPF